MPARDSAPHEPLMQAGTTVKMRLDADMILLCLTVPYTPRAT
jgi:hypothetical protein